MSRRAEARDEAAFLRGDAGVDGAATEADDRDEAERERDAAREQLLRGHAFLGRELLTWLLWRSESTAPIARVDGEDVSVVFTGRLVLRGAFGDVTELVARGTQAPYSAQVKRALDAGLLVHQARLRIEHGERAWEATLDAEHLDVRAAKLPDLIAEEDDERLLERLFLSQRLSALLDALVGEFLAVRQGRGWGRKEVPELKRWMRGE
ncbi:MAG TPA: hypothetical protein VLT47_13935 [Anaeromyxobacteraceae bacterium]|nr:hypothetical protein [Anaeromyxobacteraceae bacterium]